MECTNCGEQVDVPANFCAKCGTAVKRPKADETLKHKNDLRILLVGHTGHGKSATGNSLLGITREEGFRDQKSITSVTKEYKRLEKQRFGRKLEVVDTPGFFDTSYTGQFAYEMIYRCLQMMTPGFNAIFLVLSPTRFSAELVKTVDIFLKLFGKGVDEYAFIMFTRMKTRKDMNSYISGVQPSPEDEGQKAFEELRKRCQDKLLFIDNKSSKELKEEMVRNILTAVDEANAKSFRPYFQNKITRRIEQKARNFYQIHVCRTGYERSKEDLRILLIGLPGHGKSATENSLLSYQIFTEKTSISDNACQQKEGGKSHGRALTIVKFTVKNPSSQSDTDLKEQLLQAEKMLNPGFHALCFVIDPNRIADVKGQLQPIIEYFGDEASDYAFVLMTFTKDIDEPLKNLPDDFKVEYPEVASVFRFCKNKELNIDNEVSTQELHEMIEDMFNFIDSENRQKLTPFFSSRFKQVTEAIKNNKAAWAQVVEDAKAQAAIAYTAAAHAEKKRQELQKAFDAYKQKVENEKNKCLIL